jgi:hypothetical protein
MELSEIPPDERVPFPLLLKCRLVLVVVLQAIMLYENKSEDVHTDVPNTEGKEV